MSDLKAYLAQDSYKSVSVASLALFSLSLLLYLSQFFYLVIFSTIISLLTFYITCSLINNVLNQNQPINLNLSIPNDPKNLNYTYYYLSAKEILLTLYSNSELVKRVLGAKLTKDEKVNNAGDKVKLGVNKTHRRKKIKSFDPLLNTVDGRVHFMTSEVSTRFISSWYRSLINSHDDAFQDESKLLLDGFFKRLLLVIPFVDTDKLIVEYLAVVLRHLKEFRRAKKRIIKQNTGTIEELYRYALPQNTNESSLKEHSYKITVNTMREFISWELWNSFPCNILIAVLSEKLTLNIINYVSDPKWLLKTIHGLLLRMDSTLPSEEKPTATISNITDPLQNVETIKPINVPEIPKLELNLIHREKPAEVLYLPGTDTVDVGRQNQPLVQIDIVDTDNLLQEPLAESDDKVMPLILDSSENLNWSHFSAEDKQQVSPARTIPNILDEIPNSCTMSYKTIDLNVKEYQSTDAISPSTWNMDDFDFISMGQDLLAQTSELNLNLGKNLWNFAGDLDDVAPRKATSAAIPIPNPNETAHQQINDTLTVGALTKELQQRSAASVSDAMHKIGDLQENNSTGGMRLPKFSPRQDTGEKLNSSSDSADEVDCLAYKQGEIDDSPEYEEPTDFASSVAKLKSIIQQKTSGESTGNTPVMSPMYGDGEGGTFPYETGIGNKPLTDNIFARVTGVFNTIRTALPGNVGDIVPQSTAPTLHPMSQRWLFLEDTVYDENENFPKLLEGLLKERSDFCNVDTAYEAVDGLDLTDAVKFKRNSSLVSQTGETSYDDDLDECFSNIPKSHLLMDICCEILKDTANYAGQEPVVRAVLLLFGNLFEDFISNFTKSLVHKSDSIDSILKNIAVSEDVEVCQEDLVNLIENKIPSYIQNLIGRSDIREGIEFVLESLTHVAINKDICVLLLEILSTKIIQSNNELSPKSPFN